MCVIPFCSQPWMNVHRIHVTMEGLVTMDLTNLNVSAKQDSMEQPAEEKVSCWSLKLFQLTMAKKKSDRFVLLVAA